MADPTTEAVNILRNVLSSPSLIRTIANSSEAHMTHSARSNQNTDSEMQTLFRPSIPPTSPGPRFRTRQQYGTWQSRSRKRPRAPYHRTFNKDVILLKNPADDTVVKQRTKQHLHEIGHILSAFEFDKAWDSKTVVQKIIDAFKEKIPPDVSLEILMGCGNRLITPKLSDGQELTGGLIQKVFKLKTLYVRPSRPLHQAEIDLDESFFEVDKSSDSSNGESSTSAQCSTRDQFSLDAPSSPAGQSSSSAQLITTSNTSWESDYNTYLTIIQGISEDEDENEDLCNAIMASIEDQTIAFTEDIPVKQILKELSEKISCNQTSKFNINRAAVLDGAIRGFTRVSYNPNNRMVIRFSDDKGRYEEAIDLGGPRREFLRLLLEALMRSSLFEGKEGSLNLALDSQAIREDKYFIAGRAVAVSLVHGGPAPSCFSKTLFDCIAQGPDMCRPILEDVADCELYNKLKKVSESKTLEELQHSTEPITDYLANAGCLRPLRSIEEKDRLIEDVLMFQVINRVRGPFERFCEGLKTLGIFSKIQQHPESFRPLFCHQMNLLTAELMDDLFDIQWSESGSNKRADENRAVAFWRDYLQDVEEDAGSQKLGAILAFATGSNQVPPIGFHPRPSIKFLHPIDGPQRFPVANTCINCLRLPIYSTYGAFKSNMDFAIENTQGFGRE